MGRPRNRFVLDYPHQARCHVESVMVSAFDYCAGYPCHRTGHSHRVFITKPAVTFILLRYICADGSADLLVHCRDDIFLPIMWSSFPQPKFVREDLSLPALWPQAQTGLTNR